MANSNPNPPLTPLELVSRAVAIVTDITHYNSTLPQPVPITEDLSSTISVIASMLTSLDATLKRFPNLEIQVPSGQAIHLSSTRSFVHLLCQDIAKALLVFDTRFQQAKMSKVFEPNDLGLVRVPRYAWVLIMGGEQPVERLRGRLEVEKYRVRVLIDSVRWAGLRAMAEWNTDEKLELEGLRKMAPVLAERLVGVWRDYGPRLGWVSARGTAPVLTSDTPQPRVSSEKKERAVVRVSEDLPEMKGEADLSKEKKETDLKAERWTIHSAASTTTLISTKSASSTSSTATTENSVVHETYTLRRSEAKRTLHHRTYLCSLPIPLTSTYTHTPLTHYIRPQASHAGEIDAYIEQSPSMSGIKKLVLAMDDDAQHQIQKLIECREEATSNAEVKRTWELVGLVAQPRRKICARRGGRWWKKYSDELVEYTLVVRGETADQQQRSMPDREADPWAPRPKQLSSTQQQQIAKLQMQAQGARMLQQQMMANQSRMSLAAANATPGAGVLRHVERKRGISVEDAEVKMVGILAGLFGAQKKESE